MSVERYESLVRQVGQPQGDLAHIWAALDAPTGADQPILLPTPDGGTRLLQPCRPVTPEVRKAIRRAAQLALALRDRTPEQIIQDGRAALERARQEAVLNGQAIAEDSGAARDEP